MDRGALRELCAALPKAELHAHLHGCARLSTIAALAPASVDTSMLLVGSSNDDDRSLSACFSIFDAIHKTVTSLATVRRIAREVLDDFAADNVKYLELRTTPRDLSDADAEGYVRALLDIFATHERDAAAAVDGWPLTARLLLSVDRSGSAERAMATVELAARLRSEAGGDGAKYIVGIDFSGNPTRGEFCEFAAAFVAAREAGLRIAAHVAELNRPEDTALILAFRPERLGHALLLSDADREALAWSWIPIELCPTSNVKTLGLASLRDHPTLRTWLDSGYPVSISTDDSTVFATTPSRELAIAAEAAELTAERVAELAAAGLGHAFADEGTIERLRLRFAAAADLALAAVVESQDDIRCEACAPACAVACPDGYRVDMIAGVPVFVRRLDL